MRAVVRDALRVLFFRANRDVLARLGLRHLAFGLVVTWIVGIGRWWDDPRATLLQQSGLGSVAYVFVLTFVLWLFAMPVAERDPSYRRMLTYVTLTAPPALLYAIPIERWVDLGTARRVNVWFLAFVAAWRVALYLRYLARGLGVRPILALCTGLLPIAIVIGLLAVFNVERAVFDIMSGLRDEGTAHDEAYAWLLGITLVSFYLSPILILVWLAGILRHRREVATADRARRT